MSEKILIARKISSHIAIHSASMLYCFYNILYDHTKEGPAMLPCPAGMEACLCLYNFH